MKEIKRYNGRGLSELFGLDGNSDPFIFKSADIIPVSSAEPHRKEMFSMGIITSGAAELKVGLNSYLVVAPAVSINAQLPIMLLLRSGQCFHNPLTTGTSNPHRLEAVWCLLL